MNQQIKILKEFKTSDNLDERLFYIAYLKKLGKIGQSIYKLNPSEEVKQSVLNIKKLIENYEI